MPWIYLDEIGTDTGSLVVLPGSHRQHDVNFTFRNNDDVDGQVVVKPTAGTCVFCHSNLWHRVTTAKQQAGRRRVLLLGYMPAWFKRELPRGIRPAISRLDDLRYDGDQETRELLGEFQWR